ncbi:hypothetical protein ONZ43_g4863 [Nemania bipapillata]|uniref:Uncharacterized protein n=1 Tax=Nemania bipapillata TaxID=110536 RepID=A0ACC2IHN5_9PEZI|nr:hypothetical protein ONZ43_g4863 [Nemania bipapillata]
MSSTDVFMSSPPRPRTLDPTSISSSSPYLPALDEIFRKRSPKKSPLRTRTHNAPIPTNSRTTFTSAADILRDAPEIDIDTETITSSPPPRRAKVAAKSVRRRVPEPDSLSDDQNSNQPALVIESSSPKDKPWQKFKSHSSTDCDNKLLSINRSNASSSRKRSDKTGEVVSRHFTTQDEDSLPRSNTGEGQGKLAGGESADRVVADTQSEIAIPRRGDWTPPRCSERIVPDSDSDAQELFSSVDRVQVSKDVFQTLYTQYGRHGPDQVPDLSLQPQTDFLKKRKRIELISTGQSESKEQPDEKSVPKEAELPKERKRRAEPKAAAPKRKTRTITELATAPFAAPVASDLELTGPITKESMLDYFDSDGAVKALVEHQSAVMSQRNPKAKDTKPATKTTRKKKAGTLANPILLSPSSALKQSSNQDFVFGTSSQLVREESPTILRDLQAAIHASGNLDSDPFDDDKGQRLWQAGARDEDGELMEMETIHLQHAPALITAPTSAATPNNRSFIDIDDILDSPLLMRTVSGAPPESGQANSHFFESQGSGQSLATEPIASESSANSTGVEPCPKYELFTDAQLSKQITSYGFKPVKKRTAMIALLEQCWSNPSPRTIR